MAGIITNMRFEAGNMEEDDRTKLQTQQQTRVQTDNPLMMQGRAQSTSDSSVQSADVSINPVDSLDRAVQPSSRQSQASASDQLQDGAYGEVERDNSLDNTNVAAVTSTSPNIEANPQSQVDDDAASPPPSVIEQRRTVPGYRTARYLVDVTRAQFTTGIMGQEPINRVEAVFSLGDQVFSLDGKPVDKLYYFTEVTGMHEGMITHRWEYEGKLIEKVSFHIGAGDWRVYSKKDLPSNMEGDWRVVVTDARDKVIKSDSFLYQDP
jgi:hypothetical protein